MGIFGDIDMGPKTHLRSLVMPQNDPTWSRKCGRGWGQMDAPGLRALIKAFFRILALLAHLYPGDVHFWASLLPRVSREVDQQSVNGQYRDTDCTATIDLKRQMLLGSYVAEQSSQQTLPRQGLYRDSSTHSL